MDSLNVYGEDSDIQSDTVDGVDRYGVGSSPVSGSVVRDHPATTMPATPIRLNCVIDDERDVFIVSLDPQETVSDLKKQIKRERKNRIPERVDTPTLQLWKPSKADIDAGPEDTLIERIRSLGSDISEFAARLDGYKTVSSIFSDEPLHSQIHIIIRIPDAEPPFKRARFDNSLQTPPKAQAGTIQTNNSPPRLTHQQTKTIMAEALAGFEKYFALLASGELDARLDSIRPEDKLTELGVGLPLNPILLLHDLGKHLDQKRIEDLFKPNTHGFCTITHLFNVSGSGKTRLALDGLCCHWGFYVSCRTIVGTASGSNDFMVATEMLQSMSSWHADPPDSFSKRTAACRIFAMLLCARFVILAQLVKQFSANTNIADARRRWVLAQVLPPCLEGHTEDLFVTVLRAFRNADTEIMLRIANELWHDITTTRKDLFPEGKKGFFIVIDEAQVAANKLNCFPSTSGSMLHAILREMVQLFQSSRIFNKIILSGTGLSMGMVGDATGCLSAKAVPTLVQQVFSNIGCFKGQDPTQEAYIRRYLTLSDNDISDRRLLERMKLWFSGRYRLTASLIEIFLHSEDVPRHRVLTSFAERLTGFKITDAIELEAGEQEISPDLDIKIKTYPSLTELSCLFKEQGLSERMPLINCLTDALLRWTIGSELTAIPIENHMHDLIALGVGFLAEMPSRFLEDNVNAPVSISEPLVVLSLRSIFEMQRWTMMQWQMTNAVTDD